MQYFIKTDKLKLIDFHFLSLLLIIDRANSNYSWESYLIYPVKASMVSSSKDEYLRVPSLLSQPNSTST